MKRPKTSDALAEWWEGFRPWLPYLVVFAVAAALYVGVTYAPYEAEVVELLAWSAPVVSAVVVFAKLGGAPRLPFALAALSTVLTLVASLAGVGIALHPPGKVGEAALEVEGEPVSFDVPGAGSRYSVYSSGRLRDVGSQGRYEIEATRGEAREAFSGTVTKRVEEGGRSRRSVVPTRTTIVHASERHDVTLVGDGALRLRLTHATRELVPEVSVSVYEYARLRDVLPWLYALLLAFALLAESLSTARHLPLAMVAAQGFSVVFGLYMMTLYEAGGVRSLAGAFVLSFGVGAGGGLLGGYVFSRWLAPKLR